jgi:hypothetical protein
MPSHPVKTAAAELVKTINRLSTDPVHRRDPKLQAVIVAAVQSVNDAAAAVLAGLPPPRPTARRQHHDALPDDGVDPADTAD